MWRDKVVRKVGLREAETKGERERRKEREKVVW